MLIRCKLYVKTASNLRENYVHERIEAGAASWTAEEKSFQLEQLEKL